MDRRAVSLARQEERREADRRTRTRGRTLLGGRILYGPEMRLSLDVRVRDLSDQGARAILPAGVPCPPSGVLLVAHTAMAYRIRTAWAEGSQAGFTFDTVWNLEAPDLPPEAKGVRRLWVELTLR